jgi:glucosamine kinase
MIGAGLVGFDSKLGNKLALRFLQYPGLNCPKIIVNDSRFTHEITFNFGPGIITIADNGSIVIGRNEKGKNISNYDLHHYAYIASRHIAYNAIYKIFSSNRKLPWSSAVFKFFKCDSKTSLYSIIRNFSKDELDQKIGKLAPLITTYAEEGEPVARSICAAGAKQMMEGIDLVASTFHIDKIPIAFVGSVVQSSFMAEELYRILTEKSVYEFDIKNIPCESVLGGVALALNELNKWDQGLLSNWKSFKLGY